MPPVAALRILIAILLRTCIFKLNVFALVAAQKLVRSCSEFLLPAVAFCADSAWRFCNVTTFNSSSHLFQVKFEHEGEELLLPRLYICFGMESVTAFVQRVRRAVAQRDDAVMAQRRRLYIDCMPKDDIATPTEETMRHAVRLALSTLSREDSIVSSALPCLKQVSGFTYLGGQKRVWLL